ncbi:MAG: hypothetical protein ABR968_12230 [Bacteroidales bacterium]|jgi:DNA-binding NarL/FixJ family response regulator
MLGLTTIPFYPNDTDMEILRMLAGGSAPKIIAATLGIGHCALRKRISRLIINLGAKTFGQMMAEYGRLRLPRTPK